MKGSTIAAVLMVSVSLVALFLAGAAGADESIIRLPVGQGEDAVTEETRPWDCCDRPVCTRSDPPLCGCKDVVEQCSATCKSCKPAKRADESAPSGYMCRDAYRGYPGPKCML